MKTYSKFAWVFIGALFFLFSPVSLMAIPIDTITYNITSDHSTGGLGFPPSGGGTVMLQNDGVGGVNVTVHLNTPYEFVLTGSADFQDFKFNVTGVSPGVITVAAHTPTLVADTGNFNGDGTGNFGFGITGPTQGNGAAGAFSSNIVFNVAGVSIGNLTQPNNLGIIFVADVYNSDPANGNTGPADVTGTAVPEPGILILLGIAMTAVGVASRYVRKI